MPSIVRDDRDALQITLKVNIARADYEEQFDTELQKYRKHASLKGFRKGKTPKTVLRKMFGRSILADVVNDVLQKHLFDYLSDQDINYLGQPIPAEEQPPVDFNPNALQDFEFVFDLGLAPEFELKGLDEGKSFEHPVAHPSDEQLDEELMNLRRRFGQSQTLEEEPAEEEDILRFKATEWAGNAPKEEGVEHEFTLFVRNATPEAKEALLGKQVGDKVVLNVFELEAEASEENVRKYMLGLDPEDEREVNPNFQLEVVEVSRFSPAELNEEFFKNAFGEGDVNDEESAKERIANDYRQYHAEASNALLFREFQDYLLEQNPIELPDAFLKRWLTYTNEKNTPENVEKGYAGFTRGMRWTLLRHKLIQHFDLRVEIEEVRERFAQQVIGYFGGRRPEWMTDDMVSGMVERMMQDEKDVESKADDIMVGKLRDALKGVFTIREISVTPEEINQRLDIARGALEEEAEFDLLTGEEE